jgi:hypothetical protein
VPDLPEPIQSAVPRPGLSPLELAQDLVSRIERGNQYARLRKRSFRRNSTAVWVSSFTLSATSTIILGLQEQTFWTGLGFVLVALVTVVNGIEPFFAWRSRWVLMEAAQYRFYRLRDDVSYYLAATPSEQLDQTTIQEFFQQYQSVWDELGSRWLEYRQPTPRP